MVSSTDPSLNFRNMSLEEDLQDIRKLILFLVDHKSSEVRHLAEAISLILLVIHFHQPKFCTLSDGGFSCFKGPNLVALGNVINRLKYMLRPARVLLNGEKVRKKVINNIVFSSQDLREFSEHLTFLRGILATQRLKGYVSYMLGKIRHSKEWRTSKFAKTSWKEIDAILSNVPECSHLHFIIRQISLKLGFNLEVVKTWIYLGSDIDLKDLYIARLVQHQKICELSRRVLRDECLMGSYPTDDTPEIQAYWLAFKTFRNDWFEHLLPDCYILTDKAERWLETQ